VKDNYYQELKCAVFLVFLIDYKNCSKFNQLTEADFWRLMDYNFSTSASSKMEYWTVASTVWMCRWL